MPRSIRIKPQTTQNARQLRAAMTNAERRLWHSLRVRQIDGHKFRRQYPLGRYIVDFVCLERRLIVEVDGGQHSERHVEDAIRSQWLRNKGFCVIRFWNNEIMNNLEGVTTMIRQALQMKGEPPSLPSPSQGEGVETRHETPV
jgi:very-short-patch-repair endonuclease